MSRQEAAGGHRLLALFAGELEDRTRRLEDGLLRLEELEPDQRRELLDELTRAAHTLKGSAGVVGAPEIATICHELEDALDALRGATGVAPGTVDHLLGEVDRLRGAAGRLTGERSGATTAGARARPRADEPDGTQASVRLPTDKLDALVGRTSALQVAAGGLGSIPERLRQARQQVDGVGAPRDHDRGGHARRVAAAALADAERRLRRVTRQVDRALDGVEVAVRDVATVPVAESCHGLRRHARDIAAQRGVQVEVHLSVDGVEIDRSAVAVIRDALLHLVRNAVDHGLESPATRRAAGKAAHGRVEVGATVVGDQVAVTVRDDGRGLDAAAIRTAASRAGEPADADPAEVVFAAGVSTAAAPSEISGRGVGLDAVRDLVEALGGTVGMQSEAGQGTTVTLHVPSTVAMARVLLVESQGNRVGVLLHGVQRLVRVRRGDVVVADGRHWCRVSQELCRLAALADAVGLGPVGPPSPSPDPAPGLVLDAAGRSVVVVADAVVGEVDVLTRPLGALVDTLPGVVGAGLLPQGQVVLVLHPAALARLVLDDRARSASPMTAGDGSARATRVLLVEDAPTTLALEQGLLEAAGYEVLPATDGRQAWSLLGREPVDVVVSDVEMPEMDGIALCRRIRGAPALRDLPIVLVTSRETEDDLRRGAEAGASAYLRKSAFAQGELVATIERVTG